MRQDEVRVLQGVEEVRSDETRSLAREPTAAKVALRFYHSPPHSKGTVPIPTGADS